MSCRYKPKFGRVLIERKIKKQTAGGLIIPDTAAQRNAPCKGKIVALGETAGWTESYDAQGNPRAVQAFNIGDTVIFGRYSGAWLDATYDNKGEENDDGSMFICQDQDILAVINPEQ